MSELLQKLSDISGVSGNENDVQDFIIEQITKYCDKVTKDFMGNIYGYKYGNGDNRKTVMLCSHTDEVGMIVSYITDDGYVKFKVVGGIDERVLLAKRVRIGKNKILGVTGIKAVHLVPKDKAKEPVKYSDMYIDIGATSKEEALEMVNIGDYINFDTKSGKHGDMLKGKAFDDRVGCYILLELMKKSYKYDICFCFTVQEEAGLRGATVASRIVKPDYCIVVENTTCLDMPDVEPNRTSTKVGYGPAITVVDNSTYPNKELRELLILCAKDGHYQIKNVSSGGNDAGAIHLNNIKTAAVSVPSRYIHSPVSAISMEDVEGCISMLNTFLEGEIEC